MKGLLSINANFQQLLLVSKEQIDEYGFIIISEEEKRQRNRWFARMRYYKGGATVGNKCHCQGLCRYLPCKTRGAHISFRKTGEYWCKECERAIRCHRCRCCGNLGRAEPRSRNRNYYEVKRIE